MKILRFYANWCHKCKIFSNRDKLKYDMDIDVDLPSYKKMMVKYQINVIPTFLALSDNNRVKGKLANPLNVEEYLEWKKKITSK